MLHLLLAVDDQVKGVGDLQQVDVSVLAMLSGLIIPIVTAIVTTKLAPSWVKAVVTAVLATVAGLVSVAIEANGHVDVANWVTGVLTSAVVAWASYYGFWKPTVAPAVQDSTKNFLIGPREK